MATMTATTLITTETSDHLEFSDASMSTSEGEQQQQQRQHYQHGTHTPRKSPRPRRSPSRLALRTAFRTFSGVATVVVGDLHSKTRPETQFLVHKELLTAASPFFAAALNGTFAEGLDQTVRLPEEKPDVFEWFLQWLYTGSLTTPATGHYSLPPQHNLATTAHPLPSAIAHGTQSIVSEAQIDGDLRNSHGSPKYFLLLDLYALSDRLLTTPLSNHIVSTLARLSESTNSVPTPSDTWILYDSIRDSSPLRALILDLFAYKKTDRLLETHKDEWHPRFLRELVVKLKRPGPEAIERHTLQTWRPSQWSSSKGCESCREVLKPSLAHEKCAVCDKAFCVNCVRRCAQEGMIMPTDTSGCKPWMGAKMCSRYHDHVDGEVCR